MTRRKKLFEDEITAWPSSLPEDIGSIAPPGTELSVDYEELGCRFLTDAVEQGRSERPVWYDEYDEPLDALAGEEHLLDLDLAMLRKSAARRLRGPGKAALAAPRMPEDFDEYLTESHEIDLTEMNIREASLLDREGDEFGETESPVVRTDDTHTHGKPRGGHARASIRPARGKRG